MPFIEDKDIGVVNNAKANMLSRNRFMADAVQESSITEQKQPLTSRVSDVLNRGVDEFNAADMRVAEGKQTRIESIFQKAGTSLKTAGEVGSETLKSVPVVGGLIDKATGAMAKNVQEYIQSDPTRKAQVESAMSAYNSLDDRTKANLSALFEVVSAVAGGGSGKAATQVVKTGAKELTETLAKRTATEVERTAAKSLKEAIDVVKPVLSDAEKQAAFKEGRVTTKGFLRKTDVLPDIRQQRMAEAVSPLVSEGRVAKSALPEKNIKEIDIEVSRINSGVKNFIADNNGPIDMNRLNSLFETAKNENRLVFASDPTIEKTFSAVKDEFIKNLKTLDTKGLFEARQQFDKIPAIKKLLQNEKIGENVKRQMVLDIRNAANEYVSELLPINNPYKQLLRNESHLIKAIETIAESSKGRINTNVIKRLIEDYPWMKYLLVGGAGAGGASFISN